MAMRFAAELRCASSHGYHSAPVAALWKRHCNSVQLRSRTDWLVVRRETSGELFNLFALKLLSLSWQSLPTERRSGFHTGLLPQTLRQRPFRPGGCAALYPESRVERRNGKRLEKQMTRKNPPPQLTGDPETPPSNPEHLTRRSFIGQLGAAGLAATAGPMLPAYAREAPAKPSPPVAVKLGAGPGAIPLTLRVNGRKYPLRLEPRVTLLDCLRERLQLTGTKKGCDHGQCGACTVHINGRRVNSCLTLAAMHEADEIITIEGIGQPGNLHPMQAAFVQHDGYQCGACTSGQIMSAVAVLSEPVGPTDDDVKQAMYGNICRCGAYPNIVAAVQAVRRQA